MKISIIIPVYNVARYIEECLNSVIAQTFKGEMECILVDDCGTDDSIAICERIISRYNGPISFRIVHHEHNSGLSAARNTGIDASTGGWLYFLDSDDSIIPECIEQMVGCLEKYPNSEMVFAGAKSSDGSFSYMMNYENRSLPEYSNNPKWIQIAMLFNLLNVTAWNKLINKAFLERNNCYFAEGYVHEDEIWNFALSNVLKTIAICNHNTYHYLIRANSIMTIDNYNDRFQNRIRLYRKLIDVIPDTDRHYYVKKIWCELITAYRKTPEKEAKREIKNVFGELLKHADLKMIPPVCLFYFMPYCFLKLRIVNWFFSKYDKRPLIDNPVI